MSARSRGRAGRRSCGWQAASAREERPGRHVVGHRRIPAEHRVPDSALPAVLSRVVQPDAERLPVAVAFIAGWFGDPVALARAVLDGERQVKLCTQSRLAAAAAWGSPVSSSPPTRPRRAHQPAEADRPARWRPAQTAGGCGSHRAFSKRYAKAERTRPSDTSSSTIRVRSST
jgi:hypothetical protein